MGIKVTIKLDNRKIRVYLEGNEITINEIENYLKNQGYKNADECLKAEEKAREQKPSGYSVANYSMAYTTIQGESKKTLIIEAWFKIEKHFTNETLAIAIGNLVKPILPPINNDIVPKPNMEVSGLKSRHYVTVFKQDQTALDEVLKLVYNLESVVLDVRKQAGLESDKIQSDVKVLFGQISPAVHAKGLRVFGLMPAPTRNANTVPISNSTPILRSADYFSNKTF